MTTFYFNEECVTLEYNTEKLKNLRDVLLYSPRAIDSNEKVLFILYQLLKFVRQLNSVNLNLGELKISDIYIDEHYWIRIKLPIESILNLYSSNQNIDQREDLENELNQDEFLTRLNSNTEISLYLENIYESYRHLNYQDLANITKNWCNNKMSNFDYLLMLNCIAGRKLNSPFNHPIFPWISDFQSTNTNLRDLTKSKFRLAKGDAHLDLIYQASLGSSPYHLTEFLSEITYFVYKSRIIDKETLCKHVRRNWVPKEYPISMNRLYMWTPEECIPEFYCDSSIFKSIHDDLPDLQVPDWCNNSVSEFIRMHRLLLESDLVSKKLHNWIDLVFGYKLTGEAAIEAKNVCLPLVDNHQSMKTYGVVQLFTIGHPVKIIDQTFHGKTPPKIKSTQRNKPTNVVILFNN